jgi:cytoskeletal protein RodZ
MAKNKKSYKKKHQSRDKHYGALVLVFFVAMLGTCGFFAWKQYNSRSQKDDEPAVADSKNINTAITENKVEGGDEVDTGNSADAKELTLKAAEEQEVERNENGLKIAEVYVMNVGHDTTNGVVFASGIITNVVNKSGSCTYTFTNGSETIVEVASAQPSPKETVCGMVNVDSSRFTPGQWSVQLNFKSDFAEGDSDATSFTIQ